MTVRSCEESRRTIPSANQNLLQDIKNDMCKVIIFLDSNEKNK